MTLTVGSLFSGIGGFDLGLERAGMKIIWQSEIDPFACKVLKKHWPDVPNLGDINKIDWTNIERPDVICGGYPCQPFSTAGKRGGATDPRHLWPAMFNAICLLRPRYALMENVRGHLSMGFDQVLGDLAGIGFDAEWQVIPAAAVGAPHKRDRVFIVAYSKSEFGNVSNNNSRIGLEYETLSKFGNNGGSQSLADTDGARDRGVGSLQNGGETVFRQQNYLRGKNGDASRAWWKVEPDVGRVADGVSDRVDRLRGLGNAIVPQVAELVAALVVEHSQN
jgi:DNA (cytosine-5)-methyltransferase 1